MIDNDLTAIGNDVVRHPTGHPHYLELLGELHPIKLNSPRFIRRNPRDELPAAVGRIDAFEGSGGMCACSSQGDGHAEIALAPQFGADTRGLGNDGGVSVQQ